MQPSGHEAPGFSAACSPGDGATALREGQTPLPPACSPPHPSSLCPPCWPSRCPPPPHFCLTALVYVNVLFTVQMWSFVPKC